MTPRRSSFLAFTTLAAASLLALPFGTAQAQEPARDGTNAAAAEVAPYTVFLDPPTRFVFVKLPQGWKFVGQAESADLLNLPAGVVTDLLGREPTALARARTPRGAALHPAL